MALVGWVRDRLWRATDWLVELARLRAVVAAEPVSVRQIERTLDLADACHACDPDRGRALALYLEAARGGHPEARGPARALATQLGAHVTLGELALADNDQATAAAAYLDAGVLALAVEPLRKLVARKEAGAAQLLALAENKPFDAGRAITELLAGRPAASAYVHAVRLAHLAKLDDRVPQIITAAARAHADDAEVAALVETHWSDAGNADALMEHYRGRFERAASPADYAERLRLAGIALIARNLQPGLGLRLLRMSLEQAYEARLPTSQVATWELIVAHARTQSTARELVPLIVQAMASPLSEDVAVYLARLGLEIAWRDAGDTLAAQPYAATLLDFVPDHPLAIAFSRELGVEPPPAVVPVPPPPPIATPTTTSRIPRLEDGPVKRSYVAPAAAKPSITGRLALLKPPAPRATSLKRDTSPFPISPQPRGPTPPPRAQRTVVPLDAVIELPTGAFFTTVLRDVSASGAFVVTKRHLEVGLVVAIELKVPIAGSLKVTSHRTNARIARRTDVGCGLAFVDPPPALVEAIRTNEFLLSVAQE